MNSVCNRSYNWRRSHELNTIPSLTEAELAEWALTRGASTPAVLHHLGRGTRARPAPAAR